MMRTLTATLLFFLLSSTTLFRTDTTSAASITEPTSLFTADPPAFSGPHFPAAFSALVRITTHLLSDEMRSDTGYPARERLLRLSVDRARGRARIDEGDVSYLRRFDLKKELRIDAGDYPSCKRSYLSEPIPVHQFPRGGTWVEKQEGDSGSGGSRCPAPHEDRECRLWSQEEGSGQISHVYVERDSYMPLQVVVLDASEGGDAALKPLITFSWEDIVLGPPDKQLFEHVSFLRDECDRQAGGFPWIHVFHSYFKI